MRRSRFLALATGCALLIGLCGAVLAAGPIAPASSDRCAVCGMFVERYTDWIAAIVKRDGSRLYFDGPKDMFKFLLDTRSYKDDRGEIAEVFVTDYYKTQLTDAREAFFVSGSDVMGPMGPELIAIDNEADARTFLDDHGGNLILAFDDVTLEAVPR